MQKKDLAHTVYIDFTKTCRRRLKLYVNIRRAFWFVFCVHFQSYFVDLYIVRPARLDAGLAPSHRPVFDWLTELNW